MKDLIELFEARRERLREPLAVATVLRVEGSSYRRAGARMLIGGGGRAAGSVSGGCLESSVILEGQAALADGRARLLTFDTSEPRDLVFGSGLGCQGKIWIGIETLPPGAIWPLEAAVRQVRATREAMAWVTRVRGEGGRVRFESAASAAIPGGADAGSTLVEWLEPPVALVIFGGGPDVPPLVRLAREMGHEITIVDRRPDIARPESFPGADRVLLARPPRVAELITVDARTAAVLMNHHYETDRDVLAALLPLGLPYIALLGPRRRNERMLGELRADGRGLPPGFPEALHAPAGLDLGAETPLQIALSILAEIQAAMAGRTGGKLKFRPSPIHAGAAAAAGSVCPLPV